MQWNGLKHPDEGAKAPAKAEHQGHGLSKKQRQKQAWKQRAATPQKGE